MKRKKSENRGGARVPGPGKRIGPKPRGLTKVSMRLSAEALASADALNALWSTPNFKCGRTGVVELLLRYAGTMSDAPPQWLADLPKSVIFGANHDKKPVAP